MSLASSTLILVQLTHESGRKNFAKRGPEARLYGAMFAAILFPIGMFIYAWCSFPYVPWIALVIAIVVRAFVST